MLYVFVTPLFIDKILVVSGTPTQISKPYCLSNVISVIWLFANLLVL